MTKNLIFVSRGQWTETEKSLGNRATSVIDSTPGFEAYFVETVQNLDALGRNELPRAMVGEDNGGGTVVDRTQGVIGPQVIGPRAGRAELPPQKLGFSQRRGR
jgi:hypothetical protein